MPTSATQVAAIFDDLEVSAVPGTTGGNGNQPPKDMEPAENVRYGNFMYEGASRFKLGSIRMTVSHVNEAKIIQRLDAANADTLHNFHQKVIAGTYSAGKNKHLGSHFIDLCVRSKDGYLHKCGTARLEEDDERHVELIAELQADPEYATELLKSCTFTYNSAVPIEREYDF